MTQTLNICYKKLIELVKNPAENTIIRAWSKAHGEIHCFQQDLAWGPGEAKQRWS